MHDLVSTIQVPVILGSSRPNGHTRALVESAFDKGRKEIIDLATLKMSPYDYEHANKEDAFLPLMERLDKYPIWVLATPVYWYSMSAQMKIFFDRLSDLMAIRKDLGRGLAGKTIFVMVTSSGPDLPEGFEVPFARTCDYFDMNFAGLFHTTGAEYKKLPVEDVSRARQFAQNIMQCADAVA